VWRASPPTGVGEAGIGGLGHLAVQLFARWGCEVTAISSSRAKDADAFRLGATGLITGDEVSGEHLVGVGERWASSAVAAPHGCGPWPTGPPERRIAWARAAVKR
jgi:D-arabinose 1-dehydrogenase-like Zn-dependent alcohol dehydrogenase